MVGGPALTLLASTTYAGNTTIVKSSAGATARVATSAASAFQSYIQALEAHGARILNLGGVRGGACRIPRSKHPCGLALDVCQLSRGRVDARCRLPAPKTIIKIAAASGLIEGAVWCNSDYGHVEIPTSRQAHGCKGKKRYNVSVTEYTAKLNPRDSQGGLP